MNPIQDTLWLLKTTDGELGPYTLAQLQAMARTKQLTRTALIKQEDGDNWVRAGQVPIVFSPSKIAVSTPRQNSLPSSYVSPANTPGMPPIPKNSRRSKPSTPRAVFALSLVAALSVCACAVLLMIYVVVPNWTKSRAASDSQSTNTRASDDAGSEGSAAESAHSGPDSSTPSDSQSTHTQPSGDAGSESSAGEAAHSGPAPSTASDSLTSTQEFVAKVAMSVAMIEAGNASGSGFVIAPGLVVTNYHVVGDSSIDDIVIRFPDAIDGENGPFSATVVAESPNRDLALLHCDRTPKPVPVVDSRGFPRGMDIVVIGSPGVDLGTKGFVLDNVVSRGVLGSEINYLDQPFFQLSGSVNHGNSGGPVFDQQGRVVGVATLKSSQEAIAFCIPSFEVAALYRAHNSKEHGTPEVVAAQHDARVIVRELFKSALNLSGFIETAAEVFQKANDEESADINGLDASAFVDDYLRKENAKLLKDYSLEESHLSNSSHLSIRQRSELKSLFARHQALRDKLSRPPRSLAVFRADIGSLVDQFIEQLAAVHKTLELGPDIQFFFALQ